MGRVGRAETTNSAAVLQLGRCALWLAGPQGPEARTMIGASKLTSGGAFQAAAHGVCLPRAVSDTDVVGGWAGSISQRRLRATVAHPGPIRTMNEQSRMVGNKDRRGVAANLGTTRCDEKSWMDRAGGGMTSYSPPDGPDGDRSRASARAFDEPGQIDTVSIVVSLGLIDCSFQIGKLDVFSH